MKENPITVHQTNAPATPSLFREHWQKVVALLTWVIVVVGFLQYVRVNVLTFSDALMSLQDSQYGPVLFILFYALRPLLFFPISILTAAGGFFFGATWGIVYAVVASNISAMIAYFVGVYFGQGILTDSESTNLIQRYAKRMRVESFETVIIMRLLLLPYDFVNYMSGFLQIDWKPFLLATVIGSFPATVALVLFGVAVGSLNSLLQRKFSLNPWALGASVLLVISSIIVSRMIKQREKVN